MFFDTEIKVPSMDKNPKLLRALEVLVIMCESFLASFDEVVLDNHAAIPVPLGQQARSRELRDEFEEWRRRKGPAGEGRTNQTRAREVELSNVQVAAAVGTVERICANDHTNCGRRETLLLKVGKWALELRGGESMQGGASRRGELKVMPAEVRMLEQLDFVCKAAVPLLLNSFSGIEPPR